MYGWQAAFKRNQGTMKKKEITLAGKQVTVAYCYATEIAYKDLSGQDIADFMGEVGEAIAANKMPDVKKSIFLLVAAIMSYYETKKEDAPISDAQIMTDATPLEMGAAIGAVLNLRSEFYALPEGEPKEKKKNAGKGKN